MAFEFAVTQSKAVFVGRDAELELFRQVLQGRLPQRIVHIPGEGGNGKTRLLEAMRDRAHAEFDVLVTDELVDFYKTANQTGFGLLDDVARQLGGDRFEHFRREREQFHRLLLGEPEPGEREEAVHRVTQAFLADYQALLDQGFRVVLLFDTSEEMHAVAGWFLGTLLPAILRLPGRQQPSEAARTQLETTGAELVPHTTIVIAGRQQIVFPEQLAEYVEIRTLAPLTKVEVRDFFRQGDLAESSVSDEELDQLYQRTGGRPLYVALSFDWLSNEVGTVEQLLALEAPFGEKLVSWVRRLRTLETRAILYTALAWRRMEPSLMGRLLDPGSDEAQQVELGQRVIEGLSRFSFIKYRPPSKGFIGSFQLHDEMRDLTLYYVWPKEGIMTQEALTTQIVEWYEARVGNAQLLAGRELPANDEERALVAEWLFYQGQVDLTRAFGHHERLFRQASHYLDLAFCGMLNQEMHRFDAKLTLEQQDELRYREALVAFRREDYSGARVLWSSLLRRPELDDRLRATTLLLLVELAGYTGDPDGGIEYASEGERLYAQLSAATHDPEELEGLQAEIGQLFNNRGYCYRVKGDFASALRDYEQALQMPSRPKNHARTLNNMGYIYFLQGNVTEARSYVGRSLQIRRSLGIDYELGLGYNTMGWIMEESGRTDEAADLYLKALDCFKAVPSERGQALVQRNRGRLMRVVNDYDAGIAYLEEARTVFERLGDKDNLAPVFNELGCIYRQRGMTDDWELAHHYLERGLELSRELGKGRDEADNLEDLSILHYRWANEVRRQGDVAAAAEHARLAYEYASKAHELARQHGIIYLEAKNERTFGDLAYDNGQYDDAFSHYFTACWLMARALAEGKGSTVLLQRRFEQEADRLQEQLQGLPSFDETQQQVERLLARLLSLPEQEQRQLSIVRDLLDAANRLAQRSKSFRVAAN